MQIVVPDEGYPYLPSDGGDRAWRTETLKHSDVPVNEEKSGTMAKDTMKGGKPKAAGRQHSGW
jgi:hypothetical protein